MTARLRANHIKDHTNQIHELEALWNRELGANLMKIIICIVGMN